MKILIVSNLYPPHFLGGYEIRCSLVAEGLQRAGHEVRVLTSRYGLSSGSSQEETRHGIRIERKLGQYLIGPQRQPGWPYFWKMVKPQLRDAEHFMRILDEFQPDLVNWWSVMGLTKAILSIPRLRGVLDVLYVEDDWVLQEAHRSPDRERPPWSILWRRERRRSWDPLLAWLLERYRVRLKDRGIEAAAAPFMPAHVCFVSQFLRDDFRAGNLHFPSSEVIYGGVPVDRFLHARDRSAEECGTVRLLYAGQITRDRGLHTVVAALRQLQPEARSMVSLSVVGEVVDPDYGNEVRHEIAAAGLSEIVTFQGRKGYEEMPGVYRSHDLLISPSIRKEGLPLTMMEAMMSGSAVVTTGSGGALEIARLAELPVFPKEDPLALSRLLSRLVLHRDSLRELALRGQEVALREFSSARMVQHCCESFERLHSQTRGIRKPG